MTSELHPVIRRISRILFGAEAAEAFASSSLLAVLAAGLANGFAGPGAVPGVLFAVQASHRVFNETGPVAAPPARPAHLVSTPQPETAPHASSPAIAATPALGR